MREAGKGKASISSPAWVIDYTVRLKIAWITLPHSNPDAEEKWEETEARWLESAKATAVRKYGTKRLRDENDKDEVGKGIGKGKPRRSGSRWFDGADEYARIGEWEKFNDSGIQGAEILPDSTVEVQPVPQFTSFLPVLVKVELYELDSEADKEIDEDVDFGLLDALFRLPLMW